MQQLIIDQNFYTNISQMRDVFINLDYSKNENMLQGQVCPMQFANDDMLNYMQSLVGVPTGADHLEWTPGSGTFILNNETDLPTRAICLQYPDPEWATQWVGVISINQSTDPHYLKFYRHIRTTWDGLPTDPEELSKEKLYSKEHIETFLHYENNNWETKWQETTRIELRQNQLILFRPWLFHSYSDVFGSSKEDSRLLQFFFLRPKTNTGLIEKS